MANILITTTNSIEDAKIIKYLGVVSSNMVVGTNIFSDFVASLSDFFGGTSGTYRNQLQRLYKYAFDEITDIALKKGANGIVGLHVDFDELSGKGKSMFMVSIVGTAVRLQFSSGDTPFSETEKSISLNELHLQLYRNKWENRDPNDFPSQEEWDFILSHEMPEIADSVYSAFLNSLRSFSEQADLCEKSSENYFSQLDEAVFSKVLYAHYNDNRIKALEYIKKHKLFDAKQINSLLHSDAFSDAISLLQTEKSQYSESDFAEMKEIVSFLDSLPDKGRIEEAKGLISSKQKYICPNGHKNDIEDEYCTGYECGLNIKGLTREQVAIINSFKERTAILAQLFEKTTKD